MPALENRERRTAPRRHELTGEDEQSLNRLFESVYSDGDLTVARELVNLEFHGHCSGTGEDYHGVSGLKAHASRLRMALPGLTVEIEELRSTREGFEARLTVAGRFERDFGHIDPRCYIGAPGEEPSGRTVQITGVASGALTEGQLRHCDFDWDIDELRAQR